ncbi:hypothetical protein OIN60_19650 [Paenibacillus sp. P96]|uniref:Uncharacterized protein n=1 Tax=Paenibacillus zeirhizosphaerae TaxID=2987519 RepID=A0ABT9FW31_9BACL|nr:hypothetical protein [Paenibacillus sp. P96]MDP4098943.1 hypothetical protein [Paenibacillus sp. P96]
MTSEHAKIRIDGARRLKAWEWNEGMVRLDVQDILRQCGLDEPEWLRENGSHAANPDD